MDDILLYFMFCKIVFIVYEFDDEGEGYMKYNVKSKLFNVVDS